ncbi:hypothetical protein [Mycetohabitans sp. B46]|uniref:hypothetical protein n=1 Tax=Mycetohabitans sp. B46 TaxID=2772536 RepID=UPI00307F960F
MQIIAWARNALKATLRYSPQNEGKKDRKKRTPRMRRQGGSSYIRVFCHGVHSKHRLYGMVIAAAEELRHFSLACAAHEDEALLSRAQFANGVTIDMNYEQSKQFLFT